jgi:hypothetical protein
MTEIKRFTLRLPEALLGQVRAAAKRDRRSVHGQLLWLIERGLESADDDSDQAGSSLSDPHSSPA